MRENFDFVKECLRAYSLMKARILILQRKIERTKKDIQNSDGITAISYDAPSISKTYRFSSIVENQVVKDIQKISDLEYEKEILTDVIYCIDTAIESLKINERRVINLYYLSNEKMSWDQVANILGFDTVYTKQKIHTNALRKISKIIQKHEKKLKKIE